MYQACLSLLPSSSKTFAWSKIQKLGCWWLALVLPFLRRSRQAVKRKLLLLRFKSRGHETKSGNGTKSHQCSSEFTIRTLPDLRAGGQGTTSRDESFRLLFSWDENEVVGRWRPHPPCRRRSRDGQRNSALADLGGTNFIAADEPTLNCGAGFMPRGPSLVSMVKSFLRPNHFDWVRI